MEKRIELERRGRDPDQIRDLTLDNCRCTSIAGLTDEYINLEELSLINVGLTSLNGFPKLPNLKKLELADNNIFDGLNLLHGSPKLTHLNLSGNKIKDLETLEPLKEFRNLKNLNLFNCDVTRIDNYREKIFNLIPNLEYLDGFDIHEHEAEDIEDGDNVEEIIDKENDDEEKDEFAEDEEVDDGEDDDDEGADDKENDDEENGDKNDEEKEEDEDKQ